MAAPTRWPTPSASSATCPTSSSRRSGPPSRRSADADLILHVVDGSDVDPQSQLAAVREVFADIGALDVPELLVVNKSDASRSETVMRLLRQEPGAAVVSARTGEGIDALRERLGEPAAPA